MSSHLLGRLPLMVLGSVLLLATGCPPKDTDQPDDTSPEVVDADGDGYRSDVDCDDQDPDVHPDAEESCDSVDNDCDGEVDEDGGTAWYADTDGDGYGDVGSTETGCAQPNGYVDNADDCDDSDEAIHPGADELCDGVDNDCDGDVDEDGPTTWYADGDRDGYGDPRDSVTGCEQPNGYVAEEGDCDDDDPAINPEATEECDGVDNDCDGDVDESGDVVWYADVDGDGYGDPGNTTNACTRPDGYLPDDSDCDDMNAAVHPGADELCDGVDNDCDGDVDEDDAIDGDTWYADADGDGYGDPGSTTTACNQPPGYVADDTDCDDTLVAVYPGATEYCDGIDNDCDGSVDEAGAVDPSTWYPDVDSDGWGDPLGTPVNACNAPAGYVGDNTDCDDLDSSVFPGATEFCDEIDNDCDGSVDEYGAVDAPTWYYDADGDTFGNPSRTVVLCDPPTGYVADGTDCDDGDITINPAAGEICDGVDNDCDGLIDDDDSGVTGTATWYADGDGDSYGDPTRTTTACDQPSGYVADGTDCADGDASIHPGAVEICNRLDDDCDGLTDDADPGVTGRSTWYVDADSDGYGDPTSTTVACFRPTGYVADNTDCDDGEPSANPGATEVCDDIDNDCDGTADEASAVDASTWYADADGDGYGSRRVALRACDQPDGYVADSTDCDDTHAAVNPGAPEVCNGVDDDCDGLTDDSPTDGAMLADDADNDGFGDPGTTILQCDGADNELDCDDTDPSEPQVVDGATSSTTHDGTIDHPWLTVQDGIDSALMCVVVYPDLYTENIDFFGNDVSVVSVDGPETTVIDGSGGGPVVTFATGETGDAVLSGFTLTAGTGYEETTSSSYSCGSGDTCTDYYTTWCGGGVYLDGAAPTLTDLIIEANDLTTPTDYTSGNDTYYYFSYGGGMCFRNTSVTVADVDLYENYADDGGGVYVESMAVVTMQAAQLFENRAVAGAAFEVDGGSLTLTNVLTAWNEATDTGGSVYAIDATLVMTNTASGEDDSPNAGGLYLSGTSTGTVMNAAFYGSNTGWCVSVDSTATYTGSYDNAYDCLAGRYTGITDPTGTSGNLAVAPGFVSVTADGDHTNDDWHLLATSAMLNFGNPAAAYNDADGTRNDIGAYGGPGSDWD